MRIETIAFAYWGERIAPVFDTAKKLFLLEFGNNKIIAEKKVILKDEAALQRASTLAKLEIDIIICGAISKSLYAMILSNNIKVFPFVAGNLIDVVNAWNNGSIVKKSFAMPGCALKGLESLRGSCSNKIKNKQAQACRRGHQKQELSMNNQGVMQDACCFCPQCFAEAKHNQGQPCFLQRCSKCGARMVRK